MEPTDARFTVRAWKIFEWILEGDRVQHWSFMLPHYEARVSYCVNELLTLQVRTVMRQPWNCKHFPYRHSYAVAT
jgi:hypothetical protein